MVDMWKLPEALGGGAVMAERAPALGGGWWRVRPPGMNDDIFIKGESLTPVLPMEPGAGTIVLALRRGIDKGWVPLVRDALSWFEVASTQARSWEWVCRNYDEVIPLVKGTNVGYPRVLDVWVGEGHGRMHVHRGHPAASIRFENTNAEEHCLMAREEALKLARVLLADEMGRLTGE